MVLTEDDIGWVIRRLRNDRPRVPLRMLVGHLKEWLEEARKAAAESAAVKVAEEAAEATIVLGGGRDRGREMEGDREGSEKLRECGGTGEGGFQEGAADRRIHVVGGGPYSQGERGILRYSLHGGGI